MTPQLDMTQIAKVFFQECREGLDILEGGLLSLDAGADLENINTIFRAAHSIKGGAATLGFAAVAQFTHGMETLLDEMRNGARPVTDAAIQLLLKSCDCLREMLESTQAEEPLDASKIAGLDQQITRILASGTSPVAAPSAIGDRSGSTQEIFGWTIRFEPVIDLLRLRNEPTRMFAELQRLGKFSVQANLSKLPILGAMDPEACYLSWTIELGGNIALPQLQEIFDWVDSRCTVEFTPHSRPTAPRVAASKPASDAGTIRVATGKLDAIINLVGELLITQSMLSGFADGVKPHELGRLRQGISQLSRNTRQLQESVMQIRMLPIGFAFGRFPRLVHDLSRKLGKRVELKLQGESTELDKTVLEKIGDPLVHLVRNALDHGLETPELRAAAGKRDTGTLELAAFHEGGNIIIEVRDDGAGLNKTRILQKAQERGVIAADQALTDEQVDDLIFMPGFSTAEQISDVSGRGVGMDVVRRNINDLGGQVQIFSEQGVGSTIRIRLPLTLAILDGQLVRVGEEVFIISLLAILETIQVDPQRVSKLAGLSSLYHLRDAYIPIVRLSDRFDVQPDHLESDEGLLVILEADGKRIGLLVDDLLAQQQIVIKSLETNYNAVPQIAGATILGDGTVALIIDVPDLIRSSEHTEGFHHGQDHQRIGHRAVPDFHADRRGVRRRDTAGPGNQRLG